MNPLRSHVPLALIVLLGAAVPACSGDESATPGGTQPNGTSSSSGGAQQESGTGRVKLLADGAEILAYDAQRVRATLDGTSMSFELNSDDKNHVVAITINGTASGTYPIDDDPRDGSASALMYSEDHLPNGGRDAPGVLHTDEGSVTLTQGTDRAVGTFTASAKHGIDGRTYRVEGSFDAPVMHAAER
jgi:hypothetical protein